MAMKFNKNDEWYTPYEEVKAFGDKFVKGFTNYVWCPFDEDHSSFVKYCEENNIEVVNSHINNGQDFFDNSVAECVCYWNAFIWSNPPFSKKKEVLKRLIELGSPFAMLFGINCFNNGGFLELFNEIPDLSLVFIKKRIKFSGKATPPFNCVWVCSGLGLKDKIITI